MKAGLMRRGKAAISVRSKLIRVQMLLVVPLIILILFGILYFLNSLVTVELDNARYYSLQTAAGAFESLYARCIKLLEIPYTDDDILNVLSSEPEPSKDGSNAALKAPPGLAFNALYPEVLYYEPNVSSVTLVSSRSGRTFYSRQMPARSVNGYNPDWTDLRRTEWYKNAVVVDEPVIEPAVDGELFIGSGLTLPLSQRLIDMDTGERVGVIRIDLNLSTLHKGWKNVTENENDVFIVSDQTGQIVFASSADFLQEYPLLAPANAALWQKGYRMSRVDAQNSGFSFYYLTDIAASNFNLWFLYGVPVFTASMCCAYAALFIFWSSKSIYRPIHALKTAMLQGQRKDLSVRCERLDGELGELGEAFNDLMDQVSELVAEVAVREQEKAKLSYEALQSKINPHFLYNTLNAIRWRANILGAKDVANALESLASLLRFAIKSSDEFVPFQVELEQLENYIHIMRVRYGSDIDIVFDIDEACMGYKCLKFLLQPAVENCFIHAFGNSDRDDKTIFIKASIEKDFIKNDATKKYKFTQGAIRVSVEDNGNGMTPERVEKLFQESTAAFAGIGLGSVRQRIKALFGEGYDLRIESQPGSFTRVTATIPKITLEDGR